MPEHPDLEQLRAEVSYQRQRRDLYRARRYGSRPTNESHMRELERSLAHAEERAHHAATQRRDG